MLLLVASHMRYLEAKHWLISGAVYKTTPKSICGAYKLCLRLISNSYGAMCILGTVPPRVHMRSQICLRPQSPNVVIRYVR
jgi:hypothetical protein